jgi:hypothetical protein
MAENSTSLNILTERETAEYLKVSRALLQKQRREKTGPPFVKFGGCLRYRLDDIHDYLKNHRVTPDNA